MTPFIRRWTGVLSLAVFAAESSGCYEVVRKPADGVAPRAAEHASRGEVVAIQTTDNKNIDCRGRVVSVGSDSIYVGKSGERLAAVALGDVQSVSVRQIDQGKTALLVIGTALTVLTVVLASTVDYLAGWSMPMH